MITENGWPSCGIDGCDSNPIPGTAIRIPLQRGVPNTIMKAFAADFNAFVEPLAVGADEGGWTATNSVATSNHLGGTAMDLNWNQHPMGNANAGYSPGEIATVRELLAFYEGMIYWGNDWTSPKDGMHFQMGYGTYGDPHTADFIKRKIRPDGYSTFRRGAGSSTTTASVLAQATGLSLARATQILPQVRGGLAASQCTTPLRIAMWLAQIGHESDNFNATQEYDSGANHGDPAETSDRWKYKGRTWIQITWATNYGAFSGWCFDRGLVPSARYFLDNPRALADQQWAGLGPAWYWTVARSQINSLCDRGDINEVTRLINGGDNGLNDRTARYQRALALGNQLLQLLDQGDDFMPALTDDEQHELLDLARQQAKYRRPSSSPLRWPHEGDVNTCAGFAWATDGNLHVMLVEKLAVGYGDGPAIALLYAVANTDEPGRDSDKVLANKILAKVAPADITAAQGQIRAWLDAEAAHS